MPDAASGWFNQTMVHPLGALMLLATALMTFFVPRRFALVPLLILACFVSPAQRTVVATLDFNLLRILLMVGWTRVLVRHELRGMRWTRLDAAIILWAACAAIIAGVLNSPAMLVQRLGLTYDAIGAYFLCRVLVRDWSDLRVFAQSAAVISVPVAAAFIVEKILGRNLFAFFGGVPEITTVRDGALRCQGPFTHPILAGCFWASLVPLIGALWWYRGWSRALAIIGVAASATVVFACASATPLGGLMFGCAAAALYPLHRWMSWIRWIAVGTIIILQFVMINPVWHLLARVNFVSGSTGWYRFKLIDDFLRHFSEWWLLGQQSREHWWDSGQWAVTNEYILQGLDGGLLTLLLFILMIIVAFNGVGYIIRKAQRQRCAVISEPNIGRGSQFGRDVSLNPVSGRRAMAWALGVSLGIHCVVFIGVTYFGQTAMIWYLALGFIGSLAAHGKRTRYLLVHRSSPASTPAPASPPASLPAAAG